MPRPERALEGARIAVAEQERHFGHGETAVAQQRPRHLLPERRQHGGERRALGA